MPQCSTGVAATGLCGVPGGAPVLHNKLRNKMLTARLIRRIRLIMANRVEFYCFPYLNIISRILLVRVFTQSLSWQVLYSQSQEI